VYRIRADARAPTANLVGKVVDEQTGQPVQDAKVVHPDQCVFAKTNAAGEFEMQLKLLPNHSSELRYDLQAESQDGRLAGVTTVVLSKDENRVQIAMSPATSYHGLVVDDKGSPVELAGVDLEVALDQNEQGGPLDFHASTDGEGRFTIRGIPAASKIESVRAAHAQFAENAQSELIPQSPCRIALGAPSVVSGRVINDEGKPVALAWVQLRYPGMTKATDDVAHTYTDLNGRFSISNCPEGNWTVAAEARDYALGYAEAAVSPTRPIENLEIKMPKGAWITGRLKTPDGMPAANVGVEVVGRSVQANAQDPNCGTRTNELGEFRLGPVVEGVEFAISCNNDDYTLVGSFNAEAGKEAVEIQLSPSTNGK
jgi:protocatechuate 3,4-dioxygenase beta subunit